MATNHHYTGLTDAQVLESRKKHGENRLTPPEKESLWKMYFEKFEDPLIVILMVIGFFAIGVSCYEYWGLGEDFTVFFEPIGRMRGPLRACGYLQRP